MSTTAGTVDWVGFWSTPAGRESYRRLVAALRLAGRTGTDGRVIDVRV